MIKYVPPGHYINDFLVKPEPIEITHEINYDFIKEIYNIMLLDDKKHSDINDYFLKKACYKDFNFNIFEIFIKQHICIQ